MNQRQKEREASRQERHAKTKTARQEATSLTAIFTRPHFWSKQHWTEIQNKKKKKKQDKKEKKTRKRKIKSSELLSNIKTRYSHEAGTANGGGCCNSFD